MNRRLGTLFVGLSIAAFGLVGCGDDSSEDDDGSDGGTQQTQVNTQAAASLGTSASTAIAQVQAGQGSAAAFSLLSAGSVAWTVITPTSGSTASAPAGDLGTAAQTACETECTGEGASGSCTFAGCSDGTWTIEGTMSWGEGSLDADYTVTGNLQGSTWNMSVFADLTYTETSIDGVLATDGEFSTEANGQTVSTSWDTSITYDAVTFPAGGGCPTSGSVSGSAEVTANGQSYSGDFDYTFDGTCQ